MKNLEVGTKVDFYEVVSYKNGAYVLDDRYNKVTVDMEEKKIAFVEKNNRCYKSVRYTKSFNFLIDTIGELEESLVEEVENLTDDLFQESDIAYAEEAIESESNNGGIKMNKNNDIEKYNQFAEKRRKEITDKINPTYYGTGLDVIDFCQKNNLDFMQGNVIKYVTRYKEKNGKEDLLKAMKYIERMIKENYKEV